MPLLAKEPDLYPECLFDYPLVNDGERSWWVFYTRSRQEKRLARKLLAAGIPFYLPTVKKRQRSPNGRVRTSYLPLFPNYVFMYGTHEQRYLAMKSNCISRWLKVFDGEQLWRDLCNIWRLIQTGVPLTVEQRIVPGQWVRVKSGPFKGFEGIVVKRHSHTRLLVCVRFINQGVSIELPDCQVEPA